jgi:hypothetical protein
VHGADHLRQGGRVGQAHPAGPGQQLPGLDRHLFRVPAAGEQHAHLVTNGPAVHAVAKRGDAARALESWIGRRARRRRVQALPLHQVGTVDARPDDLHYGFPRRGGRVRHLGKLQDVGSPRLGNDHGTHAHSPSSSPRGGPSLAYGPLRIAPAAPAAQRPVWHPGW